MHFNHDEQLPSTSRSKSTSEGRAERQLAPRTRIESLLAGSYWIALANPQHENDHYQLILSGSKSAYCLPSLAGSPLSLSISTAFFPLFLCGVGSSAIWSGAQCRNPQVCSSVPQLKLSHQPTRLLALLASESERKPRSIDPYPCMIRTIPILHFFAQKSTRRSLCKPIVLR